MLHYNLPEMVIGQVNDTYAMHNMHEWWINVFHNINMQVRSMTLSSQRLFTRTHIGHWVFRQLTLFGGQNLFSQVRSSTADLTAICLSGQFTPRWSSFHTLLRSWCLHQGDHPSIRLSHPGVWDQVALMPFWSWCFQVQCHKWRGVPVPNKPKVRKQIKTHTN